MKKEIRQRLEDEGLRLSAVPASRLPELEKEIRMLHTSGAITDGMNDMLESRFRFAPPEGPEAKTLLCVAAPSPVSVAVFHRGGRRLEALIPPTYTEYVRLPPLIEQRLNGVLSGFGYRAAWARGLPHKLLAARSGLARYGRNNIAYVEGMGSFVFLSVFFTGMPCEEDPWGEARRMKLCDSCAKCVNNCPTGAIHADRRVIDAERCLTMHNERDSATPFPEWIGADAHNSLVGCLACQLACPMNHDVLGYRSEPVEFDEDETGLLLKGKPMDELPAEAVDKMKKLGVDTYYEVVPRNLEALYNK